MDTVYKLKLMAGASDFDLGFSVPLEAGAALKDYEQGLIDIFNHYAMRNSAILTRLTGIEEFDPNTSLVSPEPGSSDYGQKS